MKQVSTSEMSIEEINRRIDQLRGEILGHFGISWTPLENAPETKTEDDALCVSAVVKHTTL